MIKISILNWLVRVVCLLLVIPLLTGSQVTFAGGSTAPTITSISPASGPVGGGTSVTVTGTNFKNNATVTIGGNAATSITMVNSTTITATTPAGTAGAQDVVVTNSNKSATLSGGFNYYFPVPTVSGISPSSGPTGGNTGVTITGKYFTGATAVGFGGTVATSFHVDSDIQVTAVSPSGSGTVDITVTTPGGTSAVSNADWFTHVPAPTVTGISPNSGPTAGGTSVTITGTNLSGATVVGFGGTAATITLSNSDTITAVSPQGSGTVDITVTTAGGSATLSSSFTYVPVSTISVGAQTGTLTAGTAGSATFTATTTNISNNTTVTVNWTDSSGNSTTAPTGLSASATNVKTNTNTSTITVTATTGTVAGTYYFTATSDSATSNIATVTVSAAPAPTISGISPASGPVLGNTDVTINGTNFTIGNTDVTIGGNPATNVKVIVNNNPKKIYITATTPAGNAGACDVVVTNPDGQSATLTGGFTFIPAPTISGISPTSGPAAGGTSVTITGTNLTGVTGVKFGSSDAASFSLSNSDTLIYAVSPAVKGSGTVDITVITAGGSATLSGSFTYVPAPTVTGISPPSGPATGGTSVTITGTNLSGTTRVQFGSTDAASFFLSNSDTLINAVSPSGNGIVDITVTTTGGSDTLHRGFTYVDAPTIVSIDPASGPVAGGTSVNISGTNFTSGATVTIGGNPATNVSVSNNTKNITATTPSGMTGKQDVVVTTAGGTATLTGGFTFIPAPTISGISPTSGPAAGSTSVTITGTNLTGVTGVKFGSSDAASFSLSNSDTLITAVSPSGSGTVDITVTTTGGSDTLHHVFIYVEAPTIISIDPASGPVWGNTDVTISGNNLTSGATVTIGGNPATNVSVSNNTKNITATTPTGTTGARDVVVTNSDGQSATLTDGFTYVPAPTVTGISPTTGPEAGGTSVTITGTNLTGVTGVKFGSNDAASFVANSDTQFTAVSPSGSGTVDITVTTPGGTSAISNADWFTYIPTPTGTVYTPVYTPSTTLPLSINANGTHSNTVISISGKTLADITVSSPDNNIILYIPSGTTLLTSSGTAPAYPTSINVLPDTNVPQPPPVYTIIGIPYSCTPGGLHFNPAVTFTWKLGNLPGGVSPADLEVAFYDNNSRAWVAVPSIYGPATGSVLATISHFTDYAVINTAVSTTTTTVTTTTPTTTTSVPVTTSTSSTPTTTYTPPLTTQPVVTTTTRSTQPATGMVIHSWLWPVISGVSALLVIAGAGFLLRKRKIY